MKHRLSLLAACITPLMMLANTVLAETTKEAPVPANLQFPSGEKEMLRLEAKGVQIYECKANAQDAAKFEWVFKSPEAELTDTTGKALGKHYGGPTWESNDGSKVVGEVIARADSPLANAIPWLLLSAKSISGTGIFATTKSIQRLNTIGGKAPAQCVAAEVDIVMRVSYTATYVYSR
jgi:Protein of unknown function (DUF3455)